MARPQVCLTVMDQGRLASLSWIGSSVTSAVRRDMCGVIVPRTRVVEMILVEDLRTTKKPKKQRRWWRLLGTELQAAMPVREPVYVRPVFLARVVVGPAEQEDKSARPMMTF